MQGGLEIGSDVDQDRIRCLLFVDGQVLGNGAFLLFVVQGWNSDRMSHERMGSLILTSKYSAVSIPFTEGVCSHGII